MFWIGCSVLHWVGPVQFRRKSMYLHSNFSPRPVSWIPSFDLDLPKDCNDEYWDNEDPTKRFQQPEGVPSRLTAFILLIKLMRILSVTLRTIVSHKYITNVAFPD